MKDTIKVILTYFWNLIPLLTIKSKGGNLQIGKGLIVHSGRGFHIGKNVRLGRFCRLSCYETVNGLPKITIDDNCYIGDHFSIMAGGDITIGKHTLIASYVAIISENHGMDPEAGLKYGLQPLIGKAVNIGKNCWIGEKVIIMPGVSIGDWCILAAGAVVTKNIPSYSIVAGNPARIIKTYNFERHEWCK